ncbi:MAG: thioesterase domain-containing protein [Pseudorhodoplanes sp.]|uniref:thioesterase domain-containing protein n=1 Tax=Pseudorhodoplanes sp. TaxID=1934341 RepID=UPI003D0DA82D
MKGITRNWLLLTVLISAASLVTPSFAQTAAPPANEIQLAAAKSRKAAPKRSPQTSGHVYLLRGLLNIFSLGMDDLAAKIQARGISASVHNHSEWQAIADDIAVKYKARQHGPVVLVGHSLGADAVMYMAEYLGRKGVPVALVVPFDGTGSFAASRNVGQVMNLTQRDYAHMRKGAGFRGTLNNIDVSGQGYGHIDIDKSARLHAMVLTRIQTVIRTRGVPRTAEDQAPRPRAAPAQQAAPAPEPKPATASASTSALAPASDAAAGKPSTPAKPAAVAPVSAEAAGSAQAASKPGAPAEAAKPAPATTASTNASASVSAERGVSPPPPVSRPATVSTEAKTKRAPSNPEATAKPALRF